MGLPLALAALSTLTGEALSSNLLATGAIDYNSSDFSIEAVADISVKAQAASRNNVADHKRSASGLESESLPRLEGIETPFYYLKPTIIVSHFYKKSH